MSYQQKDKRFSKVILQRHLSSVHSDIPYKDRLIHFPVRDEFLNQHPEVRWFKA